jgi:pimeloyl-ACP methyl ester carboxylesterase
MEHVRARAIGAWVPDGGSLRRAKIGFPVIARDRRGFCRSGRPLGGFEWTILVDDAAAIRDALA